MSKDNLVYGLAGMVLGVIVGVLIANFSGTPKQFASAPPQGQTQQAEQRGTDPGQGQLPAGHPPINDQALHQQLASQEQILKTDPTNQQALVAAGNLSFDLKNYNDAIKYYEKAIDKDPKNVNLITDLGSSYLWLNQPDKAMEYYNRSLAIEPNHFQTLMNVGIAYMSLGQKDQAAQVWQKVVDLYPNNPETAMVRDAIAKIKAEQKQK